MIPTKIKNKKIMKNLYKKLNRPIWNPNPKNEFEARREDWQFTEKFKNPETYLEIWKPIVWGERGAEFVGEGSSLNPWEQGAEFVG